MVTTDRPNTKGLIAALDIFRDTMRPFIIRCLKGVRGMRVEDALKQALREPNRGRFEQNLREGRSLEEAIDINDFQWLVRNYWNEVFFKSFKPGSTAMSTLSLISNVRNQVAHPGIDDVDSDEARARLYDISTVLKEINAPEQSRAVERIRDELFVTTEDTSNANSIEYGMTLEAEPFITPAHRFRQGRRDVYAFALDLESLNRLLPERVDDRVVRDANRPLTPSHAKKIQKYLEERTDWLLGTLLLGVSPDAVDFQSYTKEPSTDSTVGELRIRADGAASMKMFDGQHRRRAIKDVIEELSHNSRYSQKLTSLKETSMPIMLYVEDNIEALRQMFADAAQTRTIERNTVTRFDQRDAFNLAALWIAKESDLFYERVEMERASVSRSSHNIIAINQLAMTLKTVDVGFKGRVSNERNEEYMLDIESLYEKCLLWADDFMPAARDEYNDLMTGDTDNAEIPDRRTFTMAYNATVIRLFSGCYHEWTKKGEDWKPLAKFLRDASLVPGETSGTLLVETGVVAPGGISPAAQQSLIVNAIDHIIQQTRKAVSEPNIPTNGVLQ